MLNKLIKLGYSKTECKELLKVSNDINSDYQKLLNGYPIQYLIGYVDFYGNKIKVDENVLIPRFETELLVEKIIKYIKETFKNPKILDLCTGSGAIAISIKKEIECSMEASDISPSALKVAKENAKNNKTDIKFLEKDLLINNDNKYDVIISNPPYVSYDEEIMQSVYDYEPHIALFANDNGLEYYKKILLQSKKNLNQKFIIAFEIGYTQTNSIINIAKTYYPCANIYVEKDYSNKDRYIFIKNE